MSFITPALQAIPNFLSGPTLDPVTDPAAQQASAQRSYDTITPLLQQVSPLVRNAYTDLAQQRLDAGQSPYPSSVIPNLLTAAQTGAPVATPPHPSFFNRAINDLRGVVSSIPQLPVALFKEAAQLQNLPTQLAKARSLSDYAQLPGVRMVPGTHTVADIASGNYGDLWEHPLYTALDVLPAAHYLAGADILHATIADRPVTSIADAAKAVSSGIVRPAVEQFAPRPYNWWESHLGQPARDVALAASKANTELGQSVLDRIAPNDKGYGIMDPAQRMTISDPNLQRLGADIVRPLTAQYMADEFPTIVSNPERIAKITDAMTHGDFTALTPAEMGFVSHLKDHVDVLGAWWQEQNQLVAHDNELYTPQVAKRLSVMDSKVQYNRLMRDMRDVLDPATSTDISAIDQARIRTALTDPNLTLSQRRVLARASTYAMHATGHDVGTTLTTIARTSSRNAGSLADVIDGIRNNGATLTPNAARDLQREAFFDTHVAPFTDRRVTAVEQLQTRLQALNAPTRYRTLLAEEATRRMNTPESYARIQARAAMREAAGRAGPEDYAVIKSMPSLDDFRRYVSDNAYAMVPGGVDELNVIFREMAGTWERLRAEGVDPIWVHGVAPDASLVLRPTIGKTEISASQTRQAAWDFTPHKNNVVVAMNNAGMEALRTYGTERFVETVIKPISKTTRQLQEELYPQAQQIAEHTGQTVQATLNHLISSAYTKWDPSGYIGTARQMTFDPSDMWLSRNYARALDLEFAHRPSTTGLWSKAMRVFRTSILPLSPRFTVNNVIGDGIGMLGRTGPGVFKYARAAIDMVRYGTLPSEIATDLGFETSAGMIPREAIEGDIATTALRNAQREASFQGGATMRRLWDQMADAGHSVFGTKVQAIYGFHGFLNDMYHAMAYLYGKDKAYSKLIREGTIPDLAESEARQAGIELARKSLYSFQGMTPFERTIVRQIFPFYGFIKHITRYALTYPIDHPFRASFAGAIGHTVQSDYPTGLPERFMQMFSLPGQHPDAKGFENLVYLRGINPFNDLPNILSTAGFMFGGKPEWAAVTTGLNPGLKVFLEELGVNTAQGTPDLYPGTEYDPVTGQIRASSPGIFGNIAQAFIPQTRLLFDLANSHSQFWQEAQRNPQQALDRLKSGLGIPMVTSRVNVTQEEMKAERSRTQAETDALNQALKTGDWSTASTYPRLANVMQHVQQLQQSGALAGTSGAPPVTYNDLLDSAQSNLIGALTG